jgi:hypothetical protein
LNTTEVEYPAQSLIESESSERDLIKDYVKYADVLEAPSAAHEAIAIVLLSSVLNRSVHIEYGALKLPLDMWIALLSPSGIGRNTLVEMARPLLKSAELEDIVLHSTWGSKQAFYQNVAHHPAGMWIWPELSVVFKTLLDARFGGVKEWITDRYDAWQIPPKIGYRETGKKSDTPPIIFEGAPRLSILGTSSYDWFTSNLVQEDTTGGFVPRWLLRDLRGPKKLIPKPQKPDNELIPNLAESLKHAAELKGIADLSGVEEQYSIWYMEAHERFSDNSNASMAMPFYNRLRAIVLKLAVIFEVAKSGNLQISEQAMRRAIDLAGQVEQTVFELVKTGITHEGSEVNRMLLFVRGRGVAGATLSEHTKTFYSMPERERKARLQTIIDSGDVTPFRRTHTGGRGGLIFVFKDFVEQHQKEYPDDTAVAA